MTWGDSLSVVEWAVLYLLVVVGGSWILGNLKPSQEEADVATPEGQAGDLRPAGPRHDADVRSASSGMHALRLDEPRVFVRHAANGDGIVVRFERRKAERVN